MKLNTRSQKLIDSTGLNAGKNPAMVALVAFAAQNSGLDYRNYGSRASYLSEQRSISADFRRFADALAEAVREGVTDAEVIAEAPRAYSGRLEWNSVGVCPKCGERETGLRTGRTTCYKCLHQSPDFTPGNAWNYCTGQYFPTEYRKAAATLLEAATRRVRQSRPPKTQMPRTIAELKALNAQNGGCWFDRGSMRFFGTKIESGIIQGRYFVTSEQDDGEHAAWGGRRKFTVRSFDETGSVDTVGEFGGYSTRAEAVEAARNLEAAAA